MSLRCDGVTILHYPQTKKYIIFNFSGQDFRPLKIEITQFPNGFHLNMYIRETINFALIIHQFLISKNGKIVYFGLLSMFLKLVFTVYIYRSPEKATPKKMFQ